MLLCSLGCWLWFIFYISCLHISAAFIVLIHGLCIQQQIFFIIAGSVSAPKQEEVKRLPGGKIKKKEKQEIIIEKVVRNKRKCVTIVKGLELFGVKLSDASKKLGKKFATGASVVKGPTEKDQIDVQGDISYDIVEFITETWPDVPETAIYFIEDGKKVPAA
ncbi:uncharacterized protein LOC116255396 isoform X2 [Nymphaea colorata]|uniref:uncharacterized protein LOC116255396 isoform X2 n=1 Tax=Nymphaea colorata TaxID=210225 RepID=UPI00129E1DBB|nr:uncharacterized protein LOC116255396 isoform X2 [Nymphaea colorata]